MKKDSIKITILGAGSIGSYLGGLMISSEAKVEMIGRESLAKSIKANGLKLTHFKKETIYLQPGKINYGTNNTTISTADIIILTTKSHDTKEAAKIINKYAKKEALVVSFQNGVQNTQALNNELAQVVLAGVIPFNVTAKGRGWYHCGTNGKLALEYSKDPRVLELKSIFDKSGQELTLHNNILSVQWGKLLVNLNNALNTLAGIPLKSCLSQREYRKSLALVIEEALLVIRSAGIEPANFGGAHPSKMIKILRLPNLPYSLLMRTVVKIDEKARSSMLDDLESGKNSELDYLQGEIIKLAKKNNQKAAYNILIYKAVEKAFKTHTSPKLKGSDIYEMLTNH